jgi:hypothetical protein
MSGLGSKSAEVFVSAKKSWVDKVVQASSLRAGWKPALPCRRLSQDFFALTGFFDREGSGTSKSSWRLCAEWSYTVRPVR